MLIHMIQPFFPIISLFVAYKVLSIVTKGLYILDDGEGTQASIRTDGNKWIVRSLSGEKRSVVHDPNLT